MNATMNISSNTMFASERSLRDSVDSSLVHTPAHSRAEIECRPRRHALYAEVRFATDDSAAHGCARLIPGLFPGRLRRWKAAGPTPPATTANTGSRSLELAHVGCAAGRRAFEMYHTLGRFRGPTDPANDPAALSPPTGRLLARERRRAYSGDMRLAENPFEAPTRRTIS